MYFCGENLNPDEQELCGFRTNIDIPKTEPRIDGRQINYCQDCPEPPPPGKESIPEDFWEDL